MVVGPSRNNLSNLNVVINEIINALGNDTIDCITVAQLTVIVITPLPNFAICRQAVMLLAPENTSTKRTSGFSVATLLGM